MRCTESESEDEISADAGENFFDPFWLLFTDEDEQGSHADTSSDDRKKQDHDNYENREERDTMEYSDQRNLEQKRHQKKQKHYWRRNQPKLADKGRRLGFGRKSSSGKRTMVVSSSNSLESGSLLTEPTDVPDESIASSTRESSATLEAVEGNDEGFRSLIATVLGRPWDVWDARSSPDGSSVGSRYSDDDTCDDVSKLSSIVGPVPEDKRLVQQFLVQYSTVEGLKEASPEPAFSSLPKEPQRAREIFSEALPEEALPVKMLRSRADISFSDRTLDLSARTLDFSATRSLAFEPSQQLFEMEEGKESGKCLSLPLGCVVANKKKVMPFIQICSMSEDDRILTSEFPKLRMVADEKVSGSKTSAVVANSASFTGTVPAHLQVSSEAFLKTKGPQSLYEYEYDGAEHVDVAYNHFGSNPLSLLVIRHHMSPPRRHPNLAIVQVEVSMHLLFLSRSECTGC
jgi:hypothetical protein